MTGFGSGRASDDTHSLIVELRSVNSKSCDVRTRLPRELSALEGRVQGAIRIDVVRGRVDVSAELTATGQGAIEPSVNWPLARGYLRTLERLRTDLGFTAAPTLELVLMAPGVIEPPDPSRTGAELSGLLDRALAQALTQLNAMRDREGAALEAELRRIEAEIVELLEAIKREVPLAATQRKARLEARISELVGAQDLDPLRLAQEVAFLVDRSDVTEELARLDSHLEQLAALRRAGGSVGRKLDFLLQEMHREANTIGAKCSSARISHSVVDLKSALERLREQVQNVE